VFGCNCWFGACARHCCHLRRFEHAAGARGIPGAGCGRPSFAPASRVLSRPQMPC
jgi:hypothetical protein